MKNSFFNVFFLFVAAIVVSSCLKEPPISTFETSTPEIPIQPHPPVIIPTQVIYFDTVLVYTDIAKDTGFWKGFTHHTFEIPAIDTIDPEHLKVGYKILYNSPYDINLSPFYELENDNSDFSYHKDGSSLSVSIFMLFSGYVTVDIRVTAFY